MDRDYKMSLSFEHSHAKAHRVTKRELDAARHKTTDALKYGEPV
jgi:hypothetical protein